MDNRRQPVILVIDDDAAIRGLLCRIMERLGIATLPASNGAEALALYAAYGPHIDAVTLDAVMPALDGGETLYELRRRGARMPVIAVSGQPPAEVARIFAKAQPDQVIVKPCTVAALVEALEGWGLIPDAALAVG